jgi:aryl-alcohol dehydrogenase-like predicted oxidoreductase
MRYGEILRGKPVPRVLQGTTMIGSDLDESESFALLDQVYELGCTIDTAHVYSGGNSERIVGRWMKCAGARSNCHHYEGCGAFRRSPADDAF